MMRNLSADQYNEFIEIGRLIDEISFKDKKKKIYIPDLNAEIDFIMKKNGIVFIAEIKKSSKTLLTGINQLKYYLYLLRKKGIMARGIIKIPKEKITKEVNLSNRDTEFIEDTIACMRRNLYSNSVPEIVKKNICKKCAYFEFCWS